MARRNTRLRAALAAFGSILLLPLGAGTAAAAPEPQPTPSRTLAERKIDTKLRAQLDQGKTAFWVRLAGSADLTTAARQQTRAEKAEAVYRAKTDYARRSQAELIELLDGVRAEYTSYWITNAIRVVGGEKLATAVAQRPEVTRIDAEERVSIPKPLAGTRHNQVDAVEWNIDRIKAPEVWERLGVRGEGIVVANIDSGVDYLHPAVKDQYRGRNADGSYSHDYNWFDPAAVCAGEAPCDNNDHGTHTMGTMVGDDGGANKIGVAPGARWIAAKGCETSSCSESSLLASGQWIVAPTDRAGQNPRPDQAPHVVNNSWGSSLHDDWYQDIVTAWRAAGIFPAFSVGNSGPGCATSGSPGDYAASYSSGAFDINDAIASFSSRGQGPSGAIKPDLAAPGVNVRSSVPDGGYAAFSGTSMASPHTAATVALMWSAAPALAGDVAQTEALLDSTAIDTDNTSCGGSAEDNNVFGEGRLDALAAVTASPRGAVGALAGTVTADGSPVAGARVSANGPTDRTTTTAEDGTYLFPALSVGAYALTAGKFGYATTTADAEVTEETTATADFQLVQAPSAQLTGTVTAAGAPASGARVTVDGTPVTAVSDDQGHFEVTLPHGTYEVRASHPSRCVTNGSSQVTIAGDTSTEVVLPERTDTYGYACATGTRAFPAGDHKIALTGDNTTERVELPFPVPLYGKTYPAAHISTNGVISFGGAQGGDFNGDIPSAATPNAALYPFWDDLVIGGSEDSGVFTAVTGTAPHRAFIVEWRRAAHWSAQGDRFTFAAVIGEDGRISYHYKDATGVGLPAGSSATIGVENATGTDAFRYSFNTPVLSAGLTVALRTTKSGVVSGRVLDANDGTGVAGASVTVGEGGGAITTSTSADGGYVVQGPTGQHPVSVTAPAYQPGTSTATITADQVTSLTQSLETGKVAASTPALEVVLPPDERRTRTVKLTNTGFPTAYALVEGAPWLSLSPVSGELATGAEQAVQVTVDTSDQQPGTVLTAEVTIVSQSGRSPELTLPVKAVVPRYRAALDVGAGTGGVDALGDSWSPDRKYTEGGHGYRGKSATKSTRHAIAGTEDQQLFRDAREGMYEYRFDNVPNGLYTVELGFAELSRTRPNKRVFDVLAEGTQVLPALDIALEAGPYTALRRSYTVAVTDGVLNVRFVARGGYGKPLLNSLRVTERPDLGG
ncbi:S8 family serine peptidase [Streptomyces sp. NPDC006879]|uniref:S8 family serine peptidase n=1 Tax=Streptomyces sp. NPDC006879 TaxID=3364767 RepID=UPI0036B32D65